MTPAAAGRSPAARSLGGVLTCMGATVVLLAVVEFALYPGAGAGPVWVLDLFTLAGLVYAATVPVAVVVHLLLAFPSGRLRSRVARWTMAGAPGRPDSAAGAAAVDAYRPSLESALGRALGDDSVRVAYWLPGRDSYAGADGRPMPMPPAGSGRDQPGRAADRRAHLRRHADR